MRRREEGEEEEKEEEGEGRRKRRRGREDRGKCCNLHTDGREQQETTKKL